MCPAAMQLSNRIDAADGAHGRLPAIAVRASVGPKILHRSSRELDAWDFLVFTEGAVVSASKPRTSYGRHTEKQADESIVQHRHRSF